MKRVLVSFLLVSLPGAGQSQSSSEILTRPAHRFPSAFPAIAPETTVLGNAFMAPKDRSVRLKGPVTILEAPEGDSWLHLSDVQAKTPKKLCCGLQAYRPDANPPVKVTHDLPDKDGWSRRRDYEYLTSPNEKRSVEKRSWAAYSGSAWTVGFPTWPTQLDPTRRGD